MSRCTDAVPPFYRRIVTVSAAPRHCYNLATLGHCYRRVVIIIATVAHRYVGEERYDYIRRVQVQRTKRQERRRNKKKKRKKREWNGRGSCCFSSASIRGKLSCQCRRVYYPQYFCFEIETINRMSLFLLLAIPVILYGITALARGVEAAPGPWQTVLKSQSLFGRANSKRMRVFALRRREGPDLSRLARLMRGEQPGSRTRLCKRWGERERCVVDDTREKKIQLCTQHYFSMGFAASSRGLREWRGKNEEPAKSKVSPGATLSRIPEEFGPRETSMWRWQWVASWAIFACSSLKLVSLVSSTTSHRSFFSRLTDTTNELFKGRTMRLASGSGMQPEGAYIATANSTVETRR